MKYYLQNKKTRHSRWEDLIDEECEKIECDDINTANVIAEIKSTEIVGRQVRVVERSTRKVMTTYLAGNNIL